MLVFQLYLHYESGKYHSVPGKHPLPGKRLCTEFQGVTAAASIQTYGIYIPGKRPCGPKSRVVFKRPWALTQDATVLILDVHYENSNFERWFHGKITRDQVEDMLDKHKNGQFLVRESQEYPGDYTLCIRYTASIVALVARSLQVLQYPSV